MNRALYPLGQTLLPTTPPGEIGQRRDGAVAVLEVVIVAPLLMLMWIVIFELGRFGDAAIDVAARGRAAAFAQRHGRGDAGKPLHWPGDSAGDVLQADAEKTLTGAGPVGAMPPATSRGVALKGHWDHHAEPLKDAPHLQLALSLAVQTPAATASGLSGKLTQIQRLGNSVSDSLRSSVERQQDILKQQQRELQKEKTRKIQEARGETEDRIQNLEQKVIPRAEEKLQRLQAEAPKRIEAGIKKLKEAAEEKKKGDEKEDADDDSDDTERDEEQEDESAAIPTPDEVQRAWDQLRLAEARRAFGKPIPGVASPPAGGLEKAKKLLEKVDPVLLENAEAWGIARAKRELARRAAETGRNSLKGSS